MLNSVSPAEWLRRGRIVVGLALLGLLAACGGSVSRVESFHPTKLVVFGDEMSLLRGDGSKYTINALVLDANSVPIAGQLNCAANPIWVQSLANYFGLVFKECPGTATTYTAQMNAAAGAKVADVVQQVASYRSGGGTFDTKTLVTVQGGVYDIKSIYAQIVAGTLTEPQGIAQAQAAGTALAGVVNNIIAGGSGGRVLYVSVPNLGLSPFGLSEQAVDANRAIWLKDLTNAFNDRLRAGVMPADGSAGPINDGHYAGPVWADARVQGMATYPTGSGYVLNDVIHRACLNDTPNCDTQATALQAADSTVTPARVAATSSNYLWADDTHLGPAAQAMIGADAVSRAVNNPF